MSNISCFEFVKKYDLRDEHCPSCHEDRDEFGFGMLDITHADGTSAAICCSVARSYRGKYNND